MAGQVSPAEFAGLVEQCRAEMAAMTPRQADAVLAGERRPECLRDRRWTRALAGVPRAAALCGLSETTVRENYENARAARRRGQATLEMIPEAAETSPPRWRVWRLIAWRAAVAGHQGAGGGRPWPPHEQYVARIRELEQERGPYAPAMTAADLRQALPGVSTELASHLLREAGHTRPQLSDAELARRVEAMLRRDRHLVTAKAISVRLGTSERRAARALAAAGGTPPMMRPPLTATRPDGLVTAGEVAAWAKVHPSTVTRHVQDGIVTKARPGNRAGRHPGLLFDPATVMAEWPGIVIG